MHRLLDAACFRRPKAIVGLDLGQAMAQQGQGGQEGAGVPDWPAGMKTGLGHKQCDLWVIVGSGMWSLSALK